MKCFFSPHSRLPLSRSPRDSLKYFEISVTRHIRFAELRKNISNSHISQMNMYFDFWIYRHIENIVEKRRNCSLRAISLYTIFCYLLLDLHVKTGTRFSLRDKRLFEISRLEITRVDCIDIFLTSPWKHILWYSLKHFTEAPLISTLSMCFYGEIRKIFIGDLFLAGATMIDLPLQHMTPKQTLHK